MTENSVFDGQFCEMISAPSICRWAGPIIDLLLDYVGHVTLCSRLMEHLNSYSDWNGIKDKAGEPVSSIQSAAPPAVHFCDWFLWISAAPPRQLLHLCRLRIQQLVRRESMQKLPLPGVMIRFLKHQETSSHNHS